MDDHLDQPTPESWLEDLHFLASLRHDGLQPIQAARLRDFLETRYTEEAVLWVEMTLIGSWNWVVRNWGLLEREGMVAAGGLRGALMSALRDWVFSKPPADSRHLPDGDFPAIIQIAKHYMDGA